MLKIINKGKIKIIKFDRPPANSFDLAFLNKIYNYLKNIEKNKDVCGVVLESNSKSVFSSGLDLRSLTKDSKHSKKNIIKAVWLIYKIVKLIVNSNKIYTAAIKGPVIGSAVSIVMACDFRFAAKNTWFWLPDPQYGGLLADGGIDIIKSVCGTNGAKVLCLTNKRIDIDYIKNNGLIDKVLNEDILEKHACYFTSDIVGNSKTTLINTKKIINRKIIKPFKIIKLLRTVNSDEMEKRLKIYVE